MPEIDPSRPSTVLPLHHVLGQPGIERKLVGEKIDHGAHFQGHEAAREVDSIQWQRFGLVALQQNCDCAALDFVAEGVGGKPPLAIVDE